MRRSRLLAIALVLFGLVALSGCLPHDSRANRHVTPLTPSTISTPTQSANPPKITKAVMQKKTLLVEGENFVDGAKLYVNGAKVKVFNDEITPTTKLVVNKANKRLPREEVVSLALQTPDGQTSESFGFFTGLILNYQNTVVERSAIVSVGQKFVLYFKDPGVTWIAHLPPSNWYPLIEILGNLRDTIPDSQGLYIARQPGLAVCVMRAFPNGQPPFDFLFNLRVVE